MAHSPPLVDHQWLIQPGNVADAIMVGSDAWFAWLDSATSFTFRSEHGSFTAHKERRSPARAYWKAHHRLAGRLQRIYLGRSAELTLERLSATAAELAAASKPALPVPTAALDSSNNTNQALPLAPTMVTHVPKPQLSAVATDNAGTLHLLTTKLTIPPLLPNLIPRPRLMARLDAIVAAKRKLTLIAAPAGSGKTTLVSQWLRTARHLRVAWLSLDSVDSQLPVFLAYLIAALETARPGIGTDAWRLLRAHAAAPPAQPILTSLINALASSTESIVVILDDYHLLAHQTVHDAIAFFLDRMPLSVHVVIASRAEPELPLARLRARNQLGEIRAADLHFTSNETGLLFNALPDVHMSADTVIALERRTEGWIAGLQLAALSLQRQDPAEVSQFVAAFSGSDAYVFDYLLDEVFHRQPMAVRTFLLQTSILRRFCASLCDALTGQDDAQARLEALERSNLFLVGLDSRRTWYRYHHLFQGFLSERLERTVSSADRAALHRRASTWFEGQGLIGEAVEHALCAQAWEDALHCLTPLMASERMYEYYLDWPRWIGLLPDAVLQSDLDRCLRLAWILVRIGQGEAAGRLLHLVEDERTSGNRAKAGLAIGMRAFERHAHGAGALGEYLARQALAMLPVKDMEGRAIPLYVLGMSELQRGQVLPALEQLTAAYMAARDSSDPFLALGTTAGLGSAYQLQGQLRQAAALYCDVLREAGDVTYRQLPLAAVGLGLVSYELNDLVAAETLLWQGITSARQVGRERYWPNAYSRLARVAQVRGDATQATALAAHALAVAREYGNPLLIAEVELEQVWLCFAQGDLAPVRDWVRKRVPHLSGAVGYESHAEALMFCRQSIAQERQEPGTTNIRAVMSVLRSLLRSAEAQERVGDIVAVLALLALAHEISAPGSENEPLARALALAEPEGYIRTFVDEGEAMRLLVQAHTARLAAGKAGRRKSAYLDRLLAAWKMLAGADVDALVLAEPLSNREHAVLRLIADGLSVHQIARALLISDHTVRTHVKKIYTKLHVHNRTQALAAARGLGLL
jgi:ATP/maltotriose-dependent transcriptional regulator MalT